MSHKSHRYREGGKRIVRYRMYQEEKTESQVPFNNDTGEETGINRRITRWVKEASCDQLRFPVENRSICSTHKPVSKNRKASSAYSERTHRSNASIARSFPPSTSYRSWGGIRTPPSHTDADHVPRLTNGPGAHCSSSSAKPPKITSSPSEVRSHSRASSSCTHSSHVTSSTKRPKDSVRSSFNGKK